METDLDVKTSTNETIMKTIYVALKDPSFPKHVKQAVLETMKNP